MRSEKKPVLRLMANGAAAAARAKSASRSAKARARAVASTMGSAARRRRPTAFPLKPPGQASPASGVYSGADEVRRVPVVDDPAVEGDVPRLTGAPEAAEDLAEWEQLDVDVDPDRREVATGDAGLLDTCGAAARVEHRAAPAITGQAARALQVRAAEGIDRRVTESGQPGRDELVGRATGRCQPVGGHLAGERAAVEREVHRPAHACAGEQRPPGVHHEERSGSALGC